MFLRLSREASQVQQSLVAAQTEVTRLVISLRTKEAEIQALRERLEAMNAGGQNADNNAESMR